MEKKGIDRYPEPEYWNYGSEHDKEVLCITPGEQSILRIWYLKQAKNQIDSDNKRRKYCKYLKELTGEIFGAGISVRPLWSINFGRGINLSKEEYDFKKDYMKRVDGYILITGPNEFISDYNDVLFRMQEFCKEHDIEYESIGSPMASLPRVEDVIKPWNDKLHKAEAEYPAWREMCDYAKTVTITPAEIEIKKLGCQCETDSGMYLWQMESHFTGHTGKYRVAVETDFYDTGVIVGENLPDNIPKIVVRFYLTLSEEYLYPWYDGRNTVGISAARITDESRALVKERLICYLKDFDEKHPLMKAGKKDPDSHNFFRLVKADFDADKDIEIYFEDGYVISDETLEETLKRSRNIVNLLTPFLTDEEGSYGRVN